ncbi:MAG: MAPEG family protein [Pseudomonadota bacterium]
MTLPEVSIAAAAILIVMQMGLMLSVGMHRASSKIGVGFAEDEHLHRKIRRHGNLAENAALFLVALALAEISGADRFYIGLLAAVFLIARTSHAIGFSSMSGSHSPNGSVIFPALRIVGAFGTIGSGVGVAILLAAQFAGGS